MEQFLCSYIVLRISLVFRKMYSALNKEGSSALWSLDSERNRKPKQHGHSFKAIISDPALLLEMQRESISYCVKDFPYWLIWMPYLFDLNRKKKCFPEIYSWIQKIHSFNEYLNIHCVWEDLAVNKTKDVLMNLYDK